MYVVAFTDKKRYRFFFFLNSKTVLIKLPSLLVRMSYWQAAFDCMAHETRTANQMLHPSRPSGILITPD